MYHVFTAAILLVLGLCIGWLEAQEIVRIEPSALFVMLLGIYLYDNYENRRGREELLEEFKKELKKLKGP